ncbi:hypothetical protein AKO1_009307 [Acrasis kona]|uniref:SAP domain-containing protein n=1 Tax=Acrasis kona TaxID=1008807 RepID=A0AAW2ZLW5_9EUKA
MKVHELKRELEKRGIDCKKLRLKAQLEEALKKAQCEQGSDNPLPDDTEEASEEETSDEEEETLTKKAKNLAVEFEQKIERKESYSYANIIGVLRSIDELLDLNENRSGDMIYSTVNFTDGSKTALYFSILTNSTAKSPHICTPTSIRTVNRKDFDIQSPGASKFHIFISSKNRNDTCSKNSKYSFFFCCNKLDLPKEIQQIILSYLSDNDFYSYFYLGKATIDLKYKMSIPSNFVLEWNINPYIFKELGLKLMRCERNRYGSWLCDSHRSKNKFKGYEEYFN